MKFFAAVALLLVVVTFSSAKEEKEVRAKGHEKASRSALYNGGLNAHQEKYRRWPPIQYGPSNSDDILIALNQILRTLQKIQAELGIPSNDQTDNSSTTESETTDEPTTESLLTEVSSEEPELTTPLVAEVPDTPEVQTSERSHSNSASRARLTLAHSKSKSHSKSSKYHSSKVKFHGKSKNHSKGHSKQATSHAEKKN